MRINYQDPETMDNLAEKLDDEQLNDIGADVVTEYETDKASRGDWDENLDEYLKLATQVVEEKSFPWKNASNIKYPLLTIAAVQFHARAYPTLLGNSEPVRCKVVGWDPDGSKSQKAQRVASYMSYQVVVKMNGWMDEMDRQLLMLPLFGTAFKKIWYSVADQAPKSIVVHPRDLVVNYTAQTLENARKTHVLYYNENEVEEFFRLGVWKRPENPLPTPEPKPKEGAAEDALQLVSPQEADQLNPHTILEQHTWLDLDDDGYKEPYIVTVEERTKSVLSIRARWGSDGVEMGLDGKVARITPDEYFEGYNFIPNPESNIYGLGFGALLGPLNHAVNSLINQLIDAGTLSNLQAGFLGRGLRFKGGVKPFEPGEWRKVDATGDDIRKSVFPLPVREPSQVLFELLQILVQAGQNLSSVQDIMVGKTPGQNTPYATTETALQQGMQVFNAIYKRIWRGLADEFKKLYRINAAYPNPVEYAQYTGETGDFQADFAYGAQYDVCPAADPDMVVQLQKLNNANDLAQALMQGMPLNPQFVTQKFLEARSIPEIKEAMNVQPQPDPKVELEKARLELEKQKFQHEAAMDEIRVRGEAAKDRAQASKFAADAQSSGQITPAEVAQLEMERQAFQNDQWRKQNEFLQKSELRDVEDMRKEREAQQKLALQQEKEAQQLAMKERESAARQAGTTPRGDER